MTLSDVVAVGTVHELDDLPARTRTVVLTPTLRAPNDTRPILTVGSLRPRAGTRRLARARPRQAGDVDAAVRNDVRGARCADRGRSAGGPRDRRLQRAPTGRRHRRRAPRRDRPAGCRCSTRRTRCGSATCRRTPTRRCATGGRTGGSASGSARRCGTATSAASTSEPTCWTPGRPGPARRRATSSAPCRSTRTLVMVGAGTAHGVHPLADGVSPFHFQRRRLALLEPPHMHTSMVLVPAGEMAPDVGDVVDVQRPLITTHRRRGGVAMSVSDELAPRAPQPTVRTAWSGRRPGRRPDRCRRHELPRLPDPPRRRSRQRHDRRVLRSVDRTAGDALRRHVRARRRRRGDVAHPPRDRRPRRRAGEAAGRWSRRGLVLYVGGLLLDTVWPGTILPFYGAMFVIAAVLFTLRSAMGAGRRARQPRWPPPACAGGRSSQSLDGDDTSWFFAPVVERRWIGSPTCSSTAPIRCCRGWRSSAPASCSDGSCAPTGGARPRSAWAFALFGGASLISSSIAPGPLASPLSSTDPFDRDCSTRPARSAPP